MIPVEVDLRPDPAGVASLGRQIKLSGRAYPLMEVAGLVVQKPDRYEITFRVMRGNEGKVLQPLFVCSLDDSIWLSEGDARRHALKAHFDTFYQTNKQPCDPPKGVWTLVAVFDDVVLGPPNYHGYQEKLRELHAQRAPRMPFEAFKSRVRIVKDESAVKQWLEGQSHRFEYVTLNVPEPKTLNSLGEVEAHSARRQDEYFFGCVTGRRTAEHQQRQNPSQESHGAILGSAYPRAPVFVRPRSGRCRCGCRSSARTRSRP